MMKLSVPVLVDRDKSVYRAYGLETAMGVLQKSAVFVIDSTGVIRWRRTSFNPYAIYDRDAVVDTLRRLQGA
jgi:alkyl hydroperoxide reductase subunit AhpC